RLRYPAPPCSAIYPLSLHDALPILDHIRRKTLDLSALKAIVLDEADEMLRMGFIEDVETVMAELPESHQTALFSATMPEPIRRIDRKSTRLNSSHVSISYAVFCLKK